LDSAESCNAGSRTQGNVDGLGFVFLLLGLEVVPVWFILWGPVPGGLTVFRRTTRRFQNSRQIAIVLRRQQRVASRRDRRISVTSHPDLARQGSTATLTNAAMTEERRHARDDELVERRRVEVELVRAGAEWRRKRRSSPRTCGISPTHNPPHTSPPRGPTAPSLAAIYLSQIRSAL
jgi:hypothetical protein